MESLVAFTVLIALVGLERIVELVVSVRNASWSRARGGVETGLGHYPFMVVLHTGLLVGALVLRTGGLEAAIAAHVVNNIFAFVLAGVTSTIADARTMTGIGWAQAFSDVITYAVFTLLAVAVARRMKVRRLVPAKA